MKSRTKELWFETKNRVDIINCHGNRRDLIDSKKVWSLFL